MVDTRLTRLQLPFDGKRMTYSGFQVILDR